MQAAGGRLRRDTQEGLERSASPGSPSPPREAGDTIPSRNVTIFPFVLFPHNDSLNRWTQIWLHSFTSPPRGRHKKKLHLLEQTENRGICHDSCKTNLSRFIQNKTATSSLISELLMNICSPRFMALCDRDDYFSSRMFPLCACPMTRSLMSGWNDVTY